MSEGAAAGAKAVRGCTVGRWEGAKQLVLPDVERLTPAAGSLPSLAQALGAVPEHRHPRGFKAHQPPYPLVPMLLLLLIGVLSGRRGYQSIADWARRCAQDHPEVLDALGFEGGRQPRTPSGRTVFRLVRDLDARAFQQALQGWLATTAAALQVTLPETARREVPEDQIVLDGKTVRGAAAHHPDEAAHGFHLVAAYGPALATVLDQLETSSKGQEMAAAQMLLGNLTLKGHLITADALHTQRAFCKTILEGDGDYLLPVKENQPTLLSDLKVAFSPSARERDGVAAFASRRPAAGSPAADASRCAPDAGAGAQSEGASRPLGAAHSLGPDLGRPERLRRLGGIRRSGVAGRRASASAGAGDHPERALPGSVENDDRGGLRDHESVGLAD